MKRSRVDDDVELNYDFKFSSCDDDQMWNNEIDKCQNYEDISLTTLSKIAEVFKIDVEHCKKVLWNKINKKIESSNLERKKIKSSNTNVDNEACEKCGQSFCTCGLGWD